MHAAEKSFKTLPMAERKMTQNTKRKDKSKNNQQSKIMSSQSVKGRKRKKRASSRSGESRKKKNGKVTQMHRVLKRTYYNQKKSGSFGGATRLFQAVKGKLKRIAPNLRKEEVIK